MRTSERGPVPGLMSFAAKCAMTTSGCLLCAMPLFAQSGNTTYYNSNGGYGGSARTTQNGNMRSTTYYNANGSYGGNSRSTTFGNQTTTQHYGANGAPAGRSVTTTFGNQTRTTHYNQYGQPVGSSTGFNSPGRSR